MYKAFSRSRTSCFYTIYPKNLHVFKYRKSRLTKSILITELCIMKTIYDFIKLNEKEKEELLKTTALFVEQYTDEHKNIQVYFLNDFFVEVTIENQKVTDMIPYQRGYKIDKNLLKPIVKYKLAA